MADEKNKKDDGVTAPDTAVDLSAQLAKALLERDEYLNGWKRAQADFINYKKEESRRFSELAQYAAADLTREVLPVLDSFELGLGALEKDSPAYKGMLMIRSQLQEVLKKKGVDRIPVARGDDFNPEFHEAMLEEEISPDNPDKDALAGKILEELVPGYSIKGRVIRAAKVKVGK